MENSQIANIFDAIADILEFKDENPFRVRSYRNTARSLRDLSQRVADMTEDTWSSIPGVGASSAQKLREIIDTGTLKQLEELRTEVPAALIAVMSVPRLGPRKAKLLHDQLKINNLDDLRKACEEGRVRDLPGMGEKTEENILKGIKTVEAASGRVLLKEAAEHAVTIGKHLDDISSVHRWQLAGSFRRRRETIGDLDVLVASTDRTDTGLRILELDGIAEVIGQGGEKISVRLQSGLQVDFRYFEEDAFGAALMYFTGSKAHNIQLRRRAQASQWKLSEYGLFAGDTRLAGDTEESVYKKLMLPWIAPELREGRGEIEAAETGQLPVLVDSADIRGDMHCHSTASDGENTIEEMADAARARGYHYLVISDHSKALSMVHGLDEERLREHAAHIRQVNESMTDFWLMAGIEVDILKNGDLDLALDLLAGLDWVNASVHSYFGLGRNEMTDRLLAAVRSGVVHCIGHPLGRQFGHRDPVDFDFDKVLEACREHHVALEINSQPQRMDLPDTFCRHARDAGVRLVVSTDAHRIAELDLMSYGVSTARRGWLSKGDVINTMTLHELRTTLARPG